MIIIFFIVPPIILFVHFTWLYLFCQTNLIYRLPQLSGCNPLENQQVGHKHDSYHPAKSGVMNGTPDMTSGRQFKPPSSCRIPEVLPEIRSELLILIFIYNSVQLSQELWTVLRIWLLDDSY